MSRVSRTTLDAVRGADLLVTDLDPAAGLAGGAGSLAVRPGVGVYVKNGPGPSDWTPLAAGASVPFDTVTGTGTASRLPLLTGTRTLGDSIATQTSPGGVPTLGVAGALAVAGAAAVAGRLDAGNARVVQGGTVRGWCYGDGDGFGLLDAAGAWAFRTSGGTSYLPLTTLAGELFGRLYGQNAFGPAAATVGVSNPGLQALSADGGPAVLAFHRVGYYAVNLGLDPDHVVRLGGWSSGATPTAEFHLATGHVAFPRGAVAAGNGQFWGGTASYVALGAGAAQFLTAGGAALPVRAGAVLASDDYTDAPLVPARGVYAKGGITTADALYAAGGLRTAAGVSLVEYETHYVRLGDPTGRTAVFLGGAGDPGSYYDNTTHYFRSRAAAPYATLGPAGLSLDGALGVTGGVSAASLTLVSDLYAGGQLTAFGAVVAAAAHVNAVAHRATGHTFLGRSAPYHVLYDADSRPAVYLGGAGDPASYYDNTAHRFRTRGGADHTVLDASGLTTAGSVQSTGGNLLVRGFAAGGWARGLSVLSADGSAVRGGVGLYGGGGAASWAYLSASPNGSPWADPGLRVAPDGTLQVIGAGGTVLLTVGASGITAGVPITAPNFILA